MKPGLSFRLFLILCLVLLALYSQDGHPIIYGTYLAACVLYATIFGQSPVGNVFADCSITPELRGFFQRIAAETTGL
jgi:hypothetical protein